MPKTTLEVKLNLPDSLANQARQDGLLMPEELERRLREALRSRRVERVIVVCESLATNPFLPMTPEEIQAKIDDYRAQVRPASGS